MVTITTTKFGLIYHLGSLHCFFWTVLKKEVLSVYLTKNIIWYRTFNRQNLLHILHFPTSCLEKSLHSSSIDATSERSDNVLPALCKFQLESRGMMRLTPKMGCLTKTSRFDVLYVHLPPQLLIG